MNDEQSEAVRDENSVFLVACPGSGKTRALTYKIAYELSRLQSKRQFIVALTYTHRAADEIHERIEGLGVDTSQLWIGTIHSFCLEWILKPYGIYEPALGKH
nr:UvrD-helicase domain-containing protein [Burkholderia cenocepacia]